MSDSAVDRPPEGFARPLRGSTGRFLVPNLVINGVLPVVLYQVLKGYGVATVLALVAGSVFPVAYTAWCWVRTRRLDFIAGISLVFILVNAAASLISGSPRFTLLKESVFTGVFGLVFLASLLSERPLMFYMARQFSTGGEAGRMRQWNDHWQYPGFRHTLRVMTVIWGAVFVADAVLRVGLVFVLSTSAFLVVSQTTFYGMFALTMYGTMAYARRRQLGAA